MKLTVHPSTSDPVRAGDSVGVICSANINKTLINVNVDIDMYLVGPNEISNMTRVTNASLGLHQASILFSNISTRDSGQYCCNATIRSSAVGYFLNSVDREDDFNLILSR